jgi:hypothetical protein
VGPGIGVGRVNRTLFMADQDMAQVIMPDDFIMDINGGTAGISEYGVNSLGFDHFHQDLCPCQFHCVLLCHSI